MISRALSIGAPRDLWRILSAAVELTKPGVTRLVVLTTLAGAWIAPGPLAVTRTIVVVFATSLVVAAANALNMYLERDIDALMSRTRGRPLPTGRVAPEFAFWFGSALSVSGLSLLALCVNLLSMLLALSALLSYVFLYTPLKRVSPLALQVGAVPGAIPPLIGWVGVTGSLGAFPLSVALILFIWQIPHFVAIAIFRQADYQRANLRVVTSVKGVVASQHVMVRYLAALLAASELPAYLGYVGAGYAATTAVAGLGFLGYGLWGIRSGAGSAAKESHATERTVWARHVFFLSMPYLMLVLAGLVISSY